MALTFELTLTGTGTLSVAGGAGVAKETVTIGGLSSLPQVGLNATDTATPGASAGVITGTCSKQYAKKHTINAGANLDLDLTTIQDGLGQTPNFATVKYLQVVLESPDGTKQVNVGPAGVANGWKGPWGADAGATDYVAVTEVLAISKMLVGWTVAAADKVLRLTNPGGAAINVFVWILGT